MESNLRRSIRSATTPESGPRKKNGAIPNAEATPTMNADSGISNMSQPDTTQFIPIAADWMRTAHHRSRKSRNSNETRPAAEDRGQVHRNRTDRDGTLVGLSATLSIERRNCPPLGLHEMPDAGLGHGQHLVHLGAGERPVLGSALHLYELRPRRS